jgi:hypothetical protein
MKLHRMKKWIAGFFRSCVIHESCVLYGKRPDGYIDYAAQILPVLKVANAMLDQA